MLPRPRRLRSSKLFAQTVRKGSRVAKPTLVIHAHLGTGETQVGFVVSKAVGNAVVRNRTKRRLRHLVASRFDDLPPGAKIVVRALPSAATVPEKLSDDLADSWTRTLAKLTETAKLVSQEVSG